MSERTWLEEIFEDVDWQPTNDNLPYVTYEGLLSEGGRDYRVSRLSDGQTVVDARDWEAVLDDLAAAREVLRELEWEGDDHETTCPSCYEKKEFGHADGCRLKEVLAATREET